MARTGDPDRRPRSASGTAGAVAVVVNVVLLVGCAWLDLSTPAAVRDEAGLDPEFAQKLLAFIVTEVVRHHEQIARDAQS